MVKKIMEECIALIRESGRDILYFDDAVETRLTPHSIPFRIWAVSVSPHDILYVMDASENWDTLEPHDPHAEALLSSLYQRLHLLRMQFAKAS